MRPRSFSSTVLIFILLLSLFGCNDISNTDEPDDLEDSNACGWADDTYEASVDYYNPETDFSNSYTLDVIVEDCRVVQINFRNGGWLDADHITPAYIENGKAIVVGEHGRTYEIELK